MFSVLFRVVVAVGGACLSSLLVALIEVGSVQRAASEGGLAEPSLGAVLPSLLGVLFPPAFVIGIAVGIASLVLEPAEMRSPRAWIVALRGGSVLEKLRNAALAPLVVVATFVGCIGAAHVARSTLATGTPAQSGWSTGVASMALFAGLFAVVVALVPLVRRTLAFGAEAVPQLLDPVVTGGFALVVVIALFGFGVARGDVGGGEGILGILGVLRREELDLSPVTSALVLVLGAYVGALTFGRHHACDSVAKMSRSRWTGLFGSALVALVFVGLCVRSSRALDREPAVLRGIEKSAPLGKISLSALRRLTDRDKDGVSSKFGGGDCDDHDPTVNPDALDIPGNGIDEDCTGADTPLPAPVDEASVSSATPETHEKRRPHNVLLITIDTLRTDLGFLGYGKSTSPNLDKLAAKSAVFERAYAMASYTGKSVGPMLIGKYPSETLRDGSHFNTYSSANAFVAERAHAAGFRTFAGHCHWYFRNPTGLNQGMDEWDTSAIPPAMGDNDTTISSDRLADVALKLLAKPENVTPSAPSGGAPANSDEKPGQGHFFAWFHFFDPHAQYVRHAEAPAFEGASVPKNLYDGEVWFTDKHVGRILDYVASQPWGADTAIVVTADHGEAFADHGMSWHGRELWESLVRVPLVVYLPGQTPIRVPVKRSHIDLVPTLLELMGIALPTTPGELRGKSLLADLDAKDGRFEERDVYIDMPTGPYNAARRALISGPSPGKKLIHFGGANYQLYDLQIDPAEGTDLAGDRAALGPMITKMQGLRGNLREIEVKPTP